MAQTNMPPETSTRWALIQRLSSLSSAATGGPMSSGRLGRPSAVTLAIKALTCLLSRTAPPAKSVSIAPGGDSVHGDTARPQLLREIARQHLDRALHRPVGGIAGQAEAGEATRTERCASGNGDYS